MVVITLHYHENCTVIFSTFHTKCYDQTTNSSSVAHPHFWQHHIAAGKHTFSIYNLKLFEPEMNTGQTKLQTICTAWVTPTVHLFSSWWHIQHFSRILALQRLFYGLPDHCRCCSISQHTQPFYAKQMPYHKKNGEECVQNILFCPPAKHRGGGGKAYVFALTLMGLNYNYAKTLHNMGNYCNAQSQHKFHPHFYSNAFPLSQMLRPSLHTTVLHTNLSIGNFCH
jgi:hypothetical protein